MLSGVRQLSSGPPHERAKTNSGHAVVRSRRSMKRGCVAELGGACRGCGLTSPVDAREFHDRSLHPEFAISVDGVPPSWQRVAAVSRSACCSARTTTARPTRAWGPSRSITGSVRLRRRIAVRARPDSQLLASRTQCFPQRLPPVRRRLPAAPTEGSWSLGWRFAMRRRCKLAPPMRQRRSRPSVTRSPPESPAADQGCLTAVRQYCRRIERPAGRDRRWVSCGASASSR